MCLHLADQGRPTATKSVYISRDPLITLFILYPHYLNSFRPTYHHDIYKW